MYMTGFNTEPDLAIIGGTTATSMGNDAAFPNAEKKHTNAYGDHAHTYTPENKIRIWV